MISNFPEIVKKHLSHLATDDYPVLNSLLFVSIWLSFVLIQSQTSMRSLFKRLNMRGVKVNFRKANLKIQHFCIQTDIHSLSTVNRRGYLFA